METNIATSLRPGLTGISLAVVVLFVIGGPALSGETLPSGPVSIAIGNEPPYTELRPDGTLSGAGPDIDRAVLGQAGITDFTGQVMDYGAMIPAVQSRRVSMVSSGGLVIRSERCEQVIFSEPVICNAEAFLVRKDMSGKFHSYAEVAKLGIKIAVPAGSVQEKNALGAGVNRDNVIGYPDGPSAVKMLQDKRIDAIALNDSGVIEMKKRAADENLETVIPISDAPMGCAGAAFNKEDTALRDAYNAGLKKLIDSGKFSEIMIQYGLGENAKLVSMRTTAALCSK